MCHQTPSLKEHLSFITSRFQEMGNIVQYCAMCVQYYLTSYTYSTTK